VLNIDQLGSIKADVFTVTETDGKTVSTKRVSIRFELYNRPLREPSIEICATLKGPRGGYSTQVAVFNLTQFHRINEGINDAVAEYEKYVEERRNNQIIDEILSVEENGATG